MRSAYQELAHSYGSPPTDVVSSAMPPAWRVWSSTKRSIMASARSSSTPYDWIVAYTSRIEYSSDVIVRRNTASSTVTVGRSVGTGAYPTRPGAPSSSSLPQAATSAPSDTVSPPTLSRPRRDIGAAVGPRSDGSGSGSPVMISLRSR